LQSLYPALQVTQFAASGTFRVIAAKNAIEMNASTEIDLWSETPSLQLASRGN